MTQAAGLGVIESDKRWRLEPYADDEWKEWLQEQKSFAGITADRANVFVQVQLDGSVRSSGLGAPNWEKLIEELPPLTDLRTTLTDGIGPGI